MTGRSAAHRGPRPTLLRSVGLTLAVATLLFVLLVPAGPVHAASSTPLTGGITGPSTVGSSLNATYRVQATGGPAMAANGTQVGVYDYKSYVTGPNVTLAGGAILPTSGVLTGGSVNLTLKAPSVEQLLTIYVLVTSTFGSTNVSQNFSYSVNIVRPYVVAANLVVVGPDSVSPFYLTVLLDGAPVGSVKVPSLSAQSSFPVSFSYVPIGLSPGWHTFSISLAQEHGLVAFSGGAQVYSQDFYVAGPPANDTIWYVTGAAAFVGAIFIWSTRVGARRRGRSKK